MRKKVLLSAYSCGPGLGSEPGVGWNWVREIGRVHDVWVVTSRENQASIERVLGEEPMPNVHWVHHDFPRWAEPWNRGLLWKHLHYYLWQLKAYRIVKQLHAQVGFDVAQHVTLAIYWRPTLLALLPVPLVWGPVGGAEACPRSFLGTLSLRGRMREVLRAVAQKVAERADPLLRLTARRATLTLASTPETAKRLANIGARNVRVIASVALHDDEIALLSQAPARNGGPFRVVSVGNLLALKGYHLGLAAFARFERVWPGSEYWLIGDGTERHRLEHLARALGVEEKVRFLGALPRSRVLDLLASCNVMLHPCLHESGGYACLEAMGAGLPVVCLDIGGPSLQVTTETGVKVPAHTPEQAEHDLAQALLMLARSPTVCRDMGEAGRARVRQHFRWEGRADLLDQLCASMSKNTVVGTESGAPMPLPGGVRR